jgi:hypothetical protein
MSELDTLCRRGLQALDDVLASKETPEKDLIAQATRCVVRHRDRLIEQRRNADASRDDDLRQVNALLSELVASEFPLVGVRRKRIEQARDAYRRMLEEEAEKGS